MNIHLNNLKKAVKVALTASVLVSTVSQAADIAVTTTYDVIDNTDNECSLREAIINANANDQSGSADCAAGTADGDDVINLPAGTYTLSIPDAVDAVKNEDAAQTGDLDITDITGTITIKGDFDASSGMPTTTIDAAGIDRIFDIFNPAEKGNLDQLDQDTKFDGVTITLQNLKLVNGLADEGNVAAGTSTVAADNQANGGAVFSWRFNDLTIDNCTFQDNQVVWDGNPDAVDDPDGIPDTGDETGPRTLSGHGGGVYSRGLLTVTNSRFIENVAYTEDDKDDNDIIEGPEEKNGNGGGVFIAFPSVITDTTFSGNTAGNGGGINTTGGDPASVGVNWTVTGSTFNANWAVMGGGLNNVSPQVNLEVINSTFSANTTTDMGAGINTNSDAYLYHATVVDNKVTSSDQAGAGINYFGPNSGYTIVNTLLSNNKGASTELNCGCTGGDAPDAACAELRVVSLGGNVSSDFNCGLNTSLGDLIGPDPGVLELADNGGPTQTHALLYDSVAIDNGKDVGCVTATTPISKLSITDDQRGVARPVDGDVDGTAACDTGAYERQTSTSDLVLSEFILESNELGVGEQMTITVSASNAGPEALSSVRIYVSLPAELEFVSSESACSVRYLKVGCVLGDMNTGSASATFVLKAVDAGELTLDATVGALEVDRDVSNNSMQNNLVITAVAAGGSSGGGFCAYNPRGRMDYILPALVFIALMSLAWRRYRNMQQGCDTGCDTARPGRDS